MPTTPPGLECQAVVADGFDAVAAAIYFIRDGDAAQPAERVAEPTSPASFAEASPPFVLDLGHHGGGDGKRAGVGVRTPTVRSDLMSVRKFAPSKSHGENRPIGSGRSGTHVRDS